MNGILASLRATPSQSEQPISGGWRNGLTGTHVLQLGRDNSHCTEGWEAALWERTGGPGALQGKPEPAVSPGSRHGQQHWELHQQDHRMIFSLCSTLTLYFDSYHNFSVIFCTLNLLYIQKPHISSRFFSIYLNVKILLSSQILLHNYYILIEFWFRGFFCLCIIILSLYIEF